MRKRTAEEIRIARDKITKWAIKFCREPEIVDDYESMVGTNSASAPGSFLRLYEAVEDYRRPAQAKLREYVAQQRAKSA